MKNLFKYDTHTHTYETSLCGLIPAADLAEMYQELNYSGIVITDHLNDEYISSLDCKEDWNACIDHFLRGYKKALERGNKIGLDVILGAEIQFESTNDNHYLLYGIDEAFLRQNPYLHRLDPWEFFRRFGSEVLIIHAHPFRDGNETVFCECVHGIEVFNGSPRHESRNEKALALYESKPEFYPFCGSDAHCNEDLGKAGMLFNGRISGSHAFHEAVKRKEYAMACAAEKRKTRYQVSLGF